MSSILIQNTFFLVNPIFEENGNHVFMEIGGIRLFIFRKKAK